MSMRRRIPLAVVVVWSLALAVAVAHEMRTPQTQSCGLGVVTDIRHGRAVCIHASERPPPGVDLERRPTTDELKERRYGARKQPAVQGTDPGTATSAGGGSVACIGDGVTGDRVQAIYARAIDVPDRFASVASLIRQYAADADYQVNLSAGSSGAGRRIRFVTESCAVSIANVTLSAAGDDSFSSTRAELMAKGFNRPDRKYLAWVDASVGICGLGELYSDDRSSSDNANNGGPSYARVDAPCWGYAEAHELLHTLGAVQDSAPNSTGAGHCFDENDTMCYSDTSGAAMSSACPSLPSWQVDCGLDDYFNAADAPPGYLSAHWNVADSAFLEGAPAPPPPPTISVTVPSSFYAGNAVGVSAIASVPPGRTFTISWSSSRADCKFVSAGGATNTFYCPVTAAGGGQVTATVTDSLGMTGSASKTFQLVKPSKKRTTIATLTRSPTSIAKGKTSKLKGLLVDKLTGKAVIGMRVTIYYRKAGTSTWKAAGTRYTDANGRFSMTVKPSKSTYYMFVSWYTSSWASDQSPSRKVSII